MQRMMHGDSWEEVFDADTEAVARHAETIRNFFHKPLSELQTKALFTGSAEDELFPENHYKTLFHGICSQTRLASAHIFEHGGHPAAMSNMAEFAALCEQFF